MATMAALNSERDQVKCSKVYPNESFGKTPFPRLWKKKESRLPVRGTGMEKGRT